MISLTCSREDGAGEARLVSVRPSGEMVTRCEGGPAGSGGGFKPERCTEAAHPAATNPVPVALP
jgi:hypothetical protein